MGRRIHAWYPPGHNEEETTVVGLGPIRLVDPKDPAIYYIMHKLLELKHLGIEFTEELVLRVVERERERYEGRGVWYEEWRNRFPLSAKTLQDAQRSVVYWLSG